MTDRFAAFLDELYHRNLDDLGMISLPEPDPVARGELLARATATAAAAGSDRLAELHSVPDRVGGLAFRSFSVRGFEPSWFGLIWGRSIGRAARAGHQPDLHQPTSRRPRRWRLDRRRLHGRQRRPRRRDRWAPVAPSRPRRSRGLTEGAISLGAG